MTEKMNFETESAVPSALDKFFANAEKRGLDVTHIEGGRLFGEVPQEIRSLNGNKVLITMKEGKRAGETIRGRAYFLDWGNVQDNAVIVYTRDSVMIKAPFEYIEDLYIQESAEKFRDAPSAGDDARPFNKILSATFAEDLEKGGVYVEHYGISDFEGGSAPESVKKLSGEKTLVFVRDGDSELRTLSGETYFEDGENPVLIIDTSASESSEVKIKDVAALCVEQSETLAEAASVKARGIPVISLKDAAAMMGVPYVNVTEEIKNEDLLGWRATKINEEIPEDVYEARMSRLASFDRDAAEEVFMRYPATKAEYFGYSVQESEAGKTVTLMMRLATCNRDAATCERIFNASALGNIQGDETTALLARRCTGLVADFNRQIGMIYDELDKKLDKETGSVMER
ncbi:MAG: hypothetical protein LUD72_01920 [Bacteroidales bacterium]|nr:hypothetical protein [Bacteroidales bacterium]